MNNEILINLNEAGNSVTVNDMDYQFVYTRVMKPDGKESPYYTLCYKSEAAPEWSIANGLLSEEFTVCRTEAVIKNIQSSLKGELIGEKHWRDKTSVKSTFMLKGYDLDIGKPEPADVLIFKLMTGVDINEIDQKTGLGFHIINGFSGKLALQLNFGFITSSYARQSKDSDLVKLMVSNVFVLDEFSHRLVHDGRMRIKYAEVQDVKDQCKSKIEEFKDIELDLNFMDTLKKVLPKKFIKNFLNVFDQLPSEYQNLYYATYIFSALLETKRRINKEINLRKFISSYVANKKLEQARQQDSN